ncbi:MAG: hypothetical protein Q7R41_16685, partial [Phycisphaerales bacterium]|nr:hypothetical protein [Phycisphaerales bacterium]
MRSRNSSFKSTVIVALLTALLTFAAAATQTATAAPSAAFNAFTLDSYQPGATNLKTLVLMVRFADDPSDPAQLPVQLSQQKDVVFTQTASVHAFFLESSWNELGLQGIVAPDGDVAGYYSTGINKPTCSTSTISQSTTAPVDVAAAAAGYDPANYDRIVYVLPTCNTAQSFSLEGTKRVWILGGSWSNAPVIAHELQHQFAVDGLTLGHANAISCVDSGTGLPAALGTSCSRSGYNDLTDVMGQPNFPHISSTFVRMG